MLRSRDPSLLPARGDSPRGPPCARRRESGRLFTRTARGQFSTLPIWNGSAFTAPPSRENANQIGGSHHICIVDQHIAPRLATVRCRVRRRVPARGALSRDCSLRGPRMQPSALFCAVPCDGGVAPHGHSTDFPTSPGETTRRGKSPPPASGRRGGRGVTGQHIELVTRRSAFESRRSPTHGCSDDSGLGLTQRGLGVTSVYRVTSSPGATARCTISGPADTRVRFGL